LTDSIIIGAGISGLSCAWFLRARGERVRVLEAAAQAGGCLTSTQHAGFLVEGGPNSTLLRGGALAQLIHELGLDARLLEANPVARRRYVVKNDRLVALPGSPPAFIVSPLFSLRAKLRLLLEPLHRRAAGEESIAQFVRRRLGPEFLDWAIDPFVSGVYAGDPARLSVRAAVARIYALEAEHGSLILGALAHWRQARAVGPMPVGRLISFRDGMQTLTHTLAASLGDAVQCGAEVSALRRDGRGWLVETPAGVQRAARLVLSVPAYRAATLLAPLDAELAAELAAIRYAPLVSVALGFGREQVAHPLDGFGLLMPSRAGRRTLGVLFSSTLFPGRAPAGQVLLTAFIGGARNEAIAGLDEAAIGQQVLGDLQPLLGIHGAPRFQQQRRWPRAIPQYELGHLERLARIDARLARLPGLQLRANWRDGISVGDCVANAARLAERLSD
jgi:protoporphyrinogen/coproporphyrinogen III oxidase